MTSPIDAHAEARRLIEERDFAGAIEHLGSDVDSDSGGERDALTGLAQFHTENYAAAAASYTKATAPTATSTGSPASRGPDWYWPKR